MHYKNLALAILWYSYGIPVWEFPYAYVSATKPHFEKFLSIRTSTRQFVHGTRHLATCTYIGHHPTTALPELPGTIYDLQQRGINNVEANLTPEISASLYAINAEFQ